VAVVPPPRVGSASPLLVPFPPMRSTPSPGFGEHTLRLPVPGGGGERQGPGPSGRRVSRSITVVGEGSGRIVSSSRRVSVADGGGGGHMRRVSTSIQLGGHKDQHGRPQGGGGMRRLAVPSSSSGKVSDSGEIERSVSDAGPGARFAEADDREDSTARSSRRRSARQTAAAANASGMPPTVPRKRSSLIVRQAPPSAAVLGAQTASADSANTPAEGGAPRSADLPLGDGGGSVASSTVNGSSTAKLQRTVTVGDSQVDMSRSSAGSDSEFDSSDCSSRSSYGSEYSDYPSGSDATDWDSDASDLDDDLSDASGKTAGSGKRRVRAWSVVPRAYFHWRDRIAWTALTIMSAIVLASLALGVLEAIQGTAS
jgi:hypothetical protein